MNPQQIQAGNWIFINAIFGERAYKVESVEKIGTDGAKVSTAYGTATFSVMLGNDNWRYAVKSDLK